jgi:alpha-amylase
MGDIDLDGELTINDATLLQFYLAELETLSDEALAVADIDNDGYIDINDATTIQKILVGLI